MWERNRSVSKKSIVGVILALFLGSLVFGSSVRADAISDAVINGDANNGIPKFLAFYNAADISGFHLGTSTSLVINENPDADIESPFPPPDGTDFFGGITDGDVFQLTINFTGGVATSGSLLEKADESVAQDGSDVVTLFSSSTLRGFGTNSTDYWFAFQNGSNVNNLIGGIIVDPGSDVKTFAVSIPEPSSTVVLVVVGIVAAMGRFSHRVRLVAV